MIVVLHFGTTQVFLPCVSVTLPIVTGSLGGY